MKYKEQTFLEKTKRFFEPVFFDKIVTLKAFFPWVIWTIIWITTVYLLKEITNKIWNWEKEEVFMLLSLFSLFVIIWYFILIFTRNWMKVTFRPIYRKYIYNYIIKKYAVCNTKCNLLVKI